MLLQERYAVGGAAAGRRGADGGQSFWGYDRREDCIVYLTAYAVAPEAQAAFLARAAALRTLSGCEAVAVPLDAFAAGQWMVAVTLPPERTLAERGQLLSDAALLALLDRLTDALLVVHSLDGQMGGNGSAVHGAPSPEAIWFFPDGRVRLFVPPVPAKGDPSDDIRGFGRVLAAAGASRSPALGAILARMCAGGYASVLEIKHELNWL